MTRHLRALVALLAVLALGLLTLAAVPATQAAPRPPAVTGKVAAPGGDGVGGLTVRLRAVGRTGPGAVIAKTTTNQAGEFALVGGSATSSYYVELVGGRYQHGWAGQDDWRAFVPKAADASTYPGNKNLGKVLALPAFVKGVVVDATTKKPVRGVKVTVDPIDDGPGSLSTKTARNGTFEITGLTVEDVHLLFDGTAAGYESGLLACSYAVVPPGQECQSPIGVLAKKVRIEKA